MLVMDCSKSASEKAKQTEAGCAIPRKPRILLAGCGTYDVCKFRAVHWKLVEWAAEVKVVLTKSALRFHGTPKHKLASIDENEWLSLRKPGVAMLHVELRNWADIMVIAPLSTNTLGKIALGLCDNLLTSVVRAWDYKKPLFVAPSMSTCIWEDFFTERHLNTIDELGIILIRPIPITTDSGEREHAMAEPATICQDVKASYYKQKQKMMQKEAMAEPATICQDVKASYYKQKQKMMQKEAMAEPATICQDVKASYYKQKQKMMQKEASTSTSTRIRFGSFE